MPIAQNSGPSYPNLYIVNLWCTSKGLQQPRLTHEKILVDPKKELLLKLSIEDLGKSMSTKE